jgi:hypothetical protein
MRWDGHRHDRAAQHAKSNQNDKARRDPAGYTAGSSEQESGANDQSYATAKMR